MNRGPEESLRLAVDALGGDKAVGAMLRPDMDPILAGQWVAHCLSPSRREKFSSSQEAFIWSRAKAIGDHRGFESFAKLCGYRVTAVIDPADELADLARQSSEAARLANALSVEVLSRMRAAGLKVDA